MAIFTDHARQRCRERGISQDDASLVIRRGNRRPADGGGWEYYIDIVTAHRLANLGVRVFDCVGVSVIVSPDDVIMTVYRNDEEAMQYRLRHEHRTEVSRLKVSLGELIGDSLYKLE